MPNKNNSGSQTTPLIKNPPEATMTNPASNSSSGVYGAGYNTFDTQSLTPPVPPGIIKQKIQEINQFCNTDFNHVTLPPWDEFAKNFDSMSLEAKVAFSSVMQKIGEMPADCFNYMAVKVVFDEKGNANVLMAKVEGPNFDWDAHLNANYRGGNASAGVNAQLFGAQIQGFQINKEEGYVFAGNLGADIGKLGVNVAAGYDNAKKIGGLYGNGGVEVKLVDIGLGGSYYGAPKFKLNKEGELVAKRWEFDINLNAGIGFEKNLRNPSGAPPKKAGKNIKGSVNKDGEVGATGQFGYLSVGISGSFGKNEIENPFLYLHTTQDAEEIERLKNKLSSPPAAPFTNHNPTGPGHVMPENNSPSPVQSKLTPPAPANVYVPRQCLEPNAPSPSASNKQLTEELIAEIKTYKPRLSN